MSEARLSPRDRRIVLQQLPRGRLGELTDHFEFVVTDRCSSDAHVDAIVRKRSLDFRHVLACFRREDLKAACEALGLDAVGREKAALIERILGSSGAAEPAPSPAEHAAPASARHDGTLKSALRRFVLERAGGPRSRDAAATFTAGLLQCFG